MAGLGHEILAEGGIVLGVERRHLWVTCVSVFGPGRARSDAYNAASRCRCHKGSGGPEVPCLLGFFDSLVPPPWLPSLGAPLWRLLGASSICWRPPALAVPAAPSWRLDRCSRFQRNQLPGMNARSIARFAALRLAVRSALPASAVLARHALRPRPRRRVLAVLVARSAADPGARRMSASARPHSARRAVEVAGGRGSLYL